MKTIGLLGGMSWESSMEYYRHINEQVKTRMGGFHSAEIVLVSLDFHRIEACQRSGDWQRAAAILIEAGLKAERAGADFLLLCTNTMHKVADELASSLSIPLISIIDATAAAVGKRGFKKVALLGTRFTMEGSFHTEALAKKGLEVMVPDLEDRLAIHRIIFEELVKGIFADASRSRFLSIITRLAANGAEGIILGCTEIGLLVKQPDIAIPLFDTTVIHASLAVDLALRN